MKINPKSFLKKIWFVSLGLTTVVLMVACRNDGASSILSGEKETSSSVVQTEWQGNEEVKAQTTVADENPITVISAPQTAPQTAPQQVSKVNPEKVTTPYSVQVGAFLKPQNANRLMTRLREKGYQPTLTVSEMAVKKWHIIRLGGYADEASALKAAKDFSRGEKMQTAVVKHDTIIKILDSEPVAAPVASSVKDKIEQPEAEPNKPNLIPGNPRYMFQVGGLHTRVSAQKQKDRLDKKGYAAFLVEIPTDFTSETWYAVRIGNYDSLDAAAEAAELFTLKESIPAQALSVVN